MSDDPEIEGYHAHVYYDEETRSLAAQLRGKIDARFEVKLGRWREAPVGPHPAPMYQVAFAPAQFPHIVPWLMLNRGGLNVLVHPLTGEDRPDHSDYALWLGERLPLNLDALGD